MSAKIIQFTPGKPSKEQTTKSQYYVLEDDEIDLLSEDEIKVTFVDHSSHDFVKGYDMGYEDGVRYALLRLGLSPDYLK